MSDRWRLQAFGMCVDCDFALPGSVRASAPATGQPRQLSLQRVEFARLPAPDAEPRTLRNLQGYDGVPYVMLEGQEGDVLFLYGRRAGFALSPDRLLLRCAFADEADPTWQRVLLDSVLWAISLLRGAELLHCSAVLRDGRMIAFAARMGGGKSSLAAESLRRGAVLFSDDVVALEQADGRMIAHCGPPLMNLPRTVAPRDVGAARVLAEFADERWVELMRDPPPPVVPAAIVILMRGEGLASACEPVAATSLDLLAHAIVLPHVGDARRRFETFAALAVTVPVFRLTADPGVPPQGLADLVDGTLG